MTAQAAQPEGGPLPPLSRKETVCRAPAYHAFSVLTAPPNGGTGKDGGCPDAHFTDEETGPGRPNPAPRSLFPWGGEDSRIRQGRCLHSNVQQILRTRRTVTWLFKHTVTVLVRNTLRTWMAQDPG